MMNPLRYLPFLPRMIRKDGPPVHLTLFVTSRCNARCAHCFNWRPANLDSSKELTPDEIERLAAQLEPLLWLAITGGEPFLREDLPLILGSFYRHCRPRHVTFNTNGLLTERIAEDVERVATDCPDSYFHIHVSLDAPGEEHDRLRGTEEAVPRVVATAAAIRRIRERRPNVGLGICTAYTSLTEDRIWETMEFVRRELRPDHWDVSLVRDPPRDPATQEVDEERFWRVKGAIEDDLMSRSFGYYPTPSHALAMGKFLFHNKITRSAGGSGAVPLPCYAGRLSVMVNDIGDLMACEMRDWKLGNLREAGFDFDAIWNGEKAVAIREGIDRGCVCDHGCNLSVNLFFNLATYPRMMAEYLRRVAGGRHR